MKKNFEIVYLLKNQSELFSNPQVFQTNDIREYERAIDTAPKNGYKVLKAGRI